MKSAVVGLVALAMGASTAVALDGPGRALVASNQIRLTVDGPFAGAPGDDVRKSFIPPYSGTVRLTWQIRSKDGTDVGGEAFVNGLSFCPENITTSTTFVTQTCDIRVAGGTPVTVSSFTVNGTNVVTLHRVQLRYNVVDFDGKPNVWEVQGAARPR
jgi:hypothetical protein